MNDLKSKIILFSWIIGLLLIITLLWNLTTPLQAHYLLRSVNNVFITTSDSRRLAAYLPQNAIKSGGKAAPFGYWYSMANSSDRMFVFAFFKDGILVPLGAIVKEDGSVAEEIIPLSAHAVQIMDSLPQSILQMYTARISEAAKNTEGKSK